MNSYDDGGVAFSATERQKLRDLQTRFPHDYAAQFPLTSLTDVIAGLDFGNLETTLEMPAIRHKVREMARQIAASDISMIGNMGGRLVFEGHALPSPYNFQAKRWHTAEQYRAILWQAVRDEDTSTPEQRALRAYLYTNRRRCVLFLTVYLPADVFYHKSNSQLNTMITAQLCQAIGLPEALLAATYLDRMLAEPEAATCIDVSIFTQQGA